MSEEIVYKIVLEDEDGYKTLFHGIEGSRRLPCNKWLRASIKYGVDGSKQKPYVTGFHCFKSNGKATEYLKKFRTDKNRVIIICFVRGLRRKPTNVDVFLADEIFIPS